MGHGCGWTSGAHMTEFSAYGARAHETGVLGMTGGHSSIEGADVLRALGTDVFSGLALEISYHGRGGRFCVGDDNRVVAGSRLHNHLQSSGEHNMSRAHSRSTLSVHPSPTLLSRCRVSMVSFSGRGGGEWLWIGEERGWFVGPIREEG